MPWRRSFVAVLFALTFFSPLFVCPVASQQVDLAATEKRYQALVAAGDNAGALVEAQKLEAAAKARFGADSSIYAITLSYMGDTYRRLERFGDAERYYTQALAVRTKLNPNDLAVAEIHDTLGWLYRYQFRLAEAEAAYRRALAIAETGGVNSASAATILIRLADLRIAGGTSMTEAEQLGLRALAIFEEIGELEGRLAAVAARLERELPDYTALVNPKLLRLEEAQRLLGADEALVFTLVSDPESYVFAVTHEGFFAQPISLKSEELARRLPRSGTGSMLTSSAARSRAASRCCSDLGLARELYAALLGPVEALIKDKRHLIVAPSGALTALPFHLLVTEKPTVAVPSIDAIAAYRDAPWLLKRHAISVLPSVASLRSLRVFARKDRGARPMVGFGDPVFRPQDLPTSRPQQRATKTATKTTARAKTRAFTDYWQAQESTGPG